MINASLNWGSIVGIILFLWAIPSWMMGFGQIFFVLQRRADTSPAVIGKTIFIVLQTLGRIVMLPLCGLILFFQGWRLDPILQFAMFLLAIGIIFESAMGIIGDYQMWRVRIGRSKASIAFTNQPSDDVEMNNIK